MPMYGKEGLKQPVDGILYGQKDWYRHFHTSTILLNVASNPFVILRVEGPIFNFKCAT